MKDEKKTKDHLLNELAELRQQIAELEKSGKQYKLIEQALNESEQKFRNIVEHSNEFFYVHNTHHKLTYASTQSLQILGYTPDEMMTEWTKIVTENPINELGIKITEKALKTGKKQKPYLLELYRKDGSKVLLEIDESPYKDKEGNVIGIVGAARDITERKQKEEALQESEKKYRDLVDNALVGIYKTKLKGDILYVNEALWRMLEFESSEEMMAESALLRYKNPKDREVLIKNLKKKDKAKNFDIELLTKTDKTKKVLLSAKLDGDILSGMIMDITERKQAEEALRYRVEFEKLINILSTNFINIPSEDLDKWINFALASVGEFVGVDRSYVFLFSRDEKKMDNTHEWCDKGIEPQIQRLKGVSIDTFPWFANRIMNGETICISRVADLPPEASAEKEEFHLSKIQSLINIPMIYRKSIIGFLGFDSVRKEKIWPEDNIILIKIIGEIFVNALVRKQAEAALKESEKRFRTIFENASDGILAVDMKTKKFHLGNKMISQMLGYNQEEINTLTVMDIHSEKDLPHVLTQFEKQAKREIILAENLPVKRKDGSVFYADVNTFYITLAGKAYMAGIFRDITERKRSEEALRESEKRYRTLFEESREAIYITTKDGKFVNVNQSMLDLFGYTKDEMLILKALQIYVNPDERTRFQQDIEQTGFVRNYKVKFRKKDGTEMDCLLTSTLWNNINETILGYQGIIRDITELKKVEDQLRYISLHDPLTGLYNRAYFEEEMHRIESGRYDSAGIIMCDVDGLKLVNDALGHYTGDNLLRETANILKESFREGDVAARVGGDEFAMLLPNSDRNAIEIARLRIQDAIERYNSSNPPLPLSISIGSAIGTGASIIMTNLFKEADNNMYREKLQNSLSARSTIVQTLMKALETRDFTAKGHVSRLRKLSIDLAMSIGLQEQKITDLRLLAEFHDIGKVGISDHILFKTGPLTSEEIIEMQRHCEIGHRIALCTPDLIPIANLILKHHEWWDGKGYPLGIKGKEIPLECRILAIAETYEAMTSDRPYHKAISHEEAVAELRRSSGTKFAPDLVTKFIEVLDNIKE